MSHYLIVNEEPMEDLATNSGWADFCDWAVELTDYPKLVELAEEGYSEDLSAVHRQLTEALDKEEPDEETASIGRLLLKGIKFQEGIMIVSDGATDEEEERE